MSLSRGPMCHDASLFQDASSQPLRAPSMHDGMPTPLGMPPATSDTNLMSPGLPKPWHTPSHGFLCPCMSLRLPHVPCTLEDMPTPSGTLPVPWMLPRQLWGCQMRWHIPSHRPPRCDAPLHPQHAFHTPNGMPTPLGTPLAMLSTGLTFPSPHYACRIASLLLCCPLPVWGMSTCPQDPRKTWGEPPHMIGCWPSSSQPPDTFAIELGSGPVPHLFGMH